MKRRDLILAIIDLCGDRPEFGRTSLQKVAYWAGQSLGFDLNHHAYFYGPFSPVIERDVEALVFSRLVEEKSRTLGINAAGFEVAKYEYTVTSQGKERIDALKEAYPEEISQLESFVSRLSEAAGSLHQRILAPATKIMFIERSEGRKLSADEITQIARNLGWKLTQPQVERVRRVTDDLEATV